ncbi:Arginase, hepatic [Nymphon striatum]|nr:Arginase, hepatic [Nymphon striatum]
MSVLSRKVLPIVMGGVSKYQSRLHNLQTLKTYSDIGIIGVPISRGQSYFSHNQILTLFFFFLIKPKYGVDRGPNILRSAGLIEELKCFGTVNDYGDLTFPDIGDDPNFGKVKHPRFIGNSMKKFSTSVQKVLEECKTCVNLGGDHSLGIGSVFGHAKVHSDLALLWIDAHADINTPESSPSGNIHGMAVAFLLKELQKKISVPGFEWLHPVLNKTQIVYIGLRDVDDGEKEILKQLGVSVFCMREIDRLGIYEVLKRALEILDPKNEKSLHVSFDIDSVDKKMVPSTGTSVIGGLNVREALCIAEELASTERVRVLDLVEVNPSLGSESDVSATVDIATRIILGFFGKQRGGNLPRKSKAI